MFDTPDHVCQFEIAFRQDEPRAAAGHPHRIESERGVFRRTAAAETVLQRSPAEASRRCREEPRRSGRIDVVARASPHSTIHRHARRRSRYSMPRMADLSNGGSRRARRRSPVGASAHTRTGIRSTHVIDMKRSGRATRDKQTPAGRRRRRRLHRNARGGTAEWRVERATPTGVGSPRRRRRGRNAPS